MIKLYFTESTKSNVIQFCDKMIKGYTWTAEEDHVSIHGLSDVTYIFSKFADMHDYHIDYDIVDIRIIKEKL